MPPSGLEFILRNQITFFTHARLMEKIEDSVFGFDCVPSGAPIIISVPVSSESILGTDLVFYTLERCWVTSV